MNSASNLCELWVVVSKGDRQVFAQLHKNLYPGLYGYVFRMIDDEETADDILQELFVKVWSKREQIGVIKNVRAYFFTAARSMTINHIRKVKHEQIRLNESCFPFQTISDEQLMIAQENTAELKNRIGQTLDQLPARQKEIIYLKYFENMDYQKIALVTGIKYQSVINHVYRAFETLRADLVKKKYQELLA
ncbi:RNA polymerase sigma factor [Mucilaginibacter sp. X5P1]|uniref:RNA polymerase sigma factor n=1 Tax=Mucilaginibacter sp. X5P1 TaxID=2723088 RepID=UPI0016109985|nr:RNA polymerase sigma factor [Mucilaginibacter sp. X5P1]MBB6138303.1 RNA polymerase sigma-70 factor (ECF subfamily) [Mucilaginibacter sp. X5P1]